jgi:hypothetical protein
MKSKSKSKFDFKILNKVYFKFVVKSKSKFILKILNKVVSNYFMKSESNLISIFMKLLGRYAPVTAANRHG